MQSACVVFQCLARRDGVVGVAARSFKMLLGPVAEKGLRQFLGLAAGGGVFEIDAGSNAEPVPASTDVSSRSRL